MNVLVVEDDPVIGKALHQGFLDHGHDCTWARDGDQGLERAQSQKFEAVILDLMLPGMPGLDVLHTLRRAGHAIPVILLTALGTVEERIAGLNAGADDYLVKPFDFAELRARLDAVTRRVVQRPSPQLRAGDLTLDLTTRRVLRDGVEIELTPTEFSLLEYLMRFAGQVVTRKMLCEHLWESDWEGTTNVIEVHINRLRNKLEKSGSDAPIQTVRGRGYALRTQ